LAERFKNEYYFAEWFKNEYYYAGKFKNKYYFTGRFKNEYYLAERFKNEYYLAKRFEGLNIQYFIYLQGENGVGAKILESPLTTLLHNSFPNILRLNILNTTS